MRLAAAKPRLYRLLAGVLCTLLVLVLAVPCAQAATPAQHKAAAMDCCGDHQSVGAPMRCCQTHTQPAELTGLHEVAMTVSLVAAGVGAQVSPASFDPREDAMSTPPARVLRTNLRL